MAVVLLGWAIISQIHSGKSLSDTILHYKDVISTNINLVRVSFCLLSSAVFSGSHQLLNFCDCSI